MAPSGSDGDARNAAEVLADAQKRINQASNSDVDLSEAVELVDQAAASFKAGDFGEAAAMAKRASWETERALKRATGRQRSDGKQRTEAAEEIEPEKNIKSDEVKENHGDDTSEEAAVEEDGSQEEPESDEEEPQDVDGSPPERKKGREEKPKGGRYRKKDGSLLKRVAFWIAAYSIVAMLYIAFFSYPVQPARLEGSAYTNSEKVYMNFPYTYEIDYISIQERSVVVILTIRTISMPDRAYSTALKYTKKMTEDYIKQNYGQDVDVEFKSESTMKINGHDAVVQKYDVFKNITVFVPLPPPGHNEVITERVAVMTMAAWFCNENFQSVITGFFHPVTVEPNIAGSIRCH